MPPTPDASQMPSRSLADELRHLLRLGAPIALVQFGTTALNFTDVALLGRHEPASLPAMALGNTVAWVTLVFCMGVVTALDPLLSQAVGARDHRAVPRLLGRGALLGLLLSVPSALLLLPAGLWLELAGQPQDLIPTAAGYARLQALGVLPFLWYSVLRSHLSAHARLGPQLWTIALGNALNVLLDWLLIFGECGLPELGADGAAIATVACRWLMFGGLLWFARGDLLPPLRALRDPQLRAEAFALRPLWRLFCLGAPIGAQFVLEIGVFAATALCIGHLDAQAGEVGGQGPRLAGHQIALQLASLSFMVPLGLGIAASVRVGWAVGRGDGAAVRRTCAAALVAAAAVMSGFMLLFLLLPEWLAGTMSEHAAVIAVAAALIPIAGVFQIGDGLQVVSIGCLRGLGDVRSPLLANLLGFWLLGLPLGLWLGYGADLGPAGLWWGLVLGLFAVAITLLTVLRWRLGEQRGRLHAE